MCSAILGECEPTFLTVFNYYNRHEKESKTFIPYVPKINQAWTRGTTKYTKNIKKNCYAQNN